MTKHSVQSLNTSVCIVGSGPAGLLLSQLLSNDGIENILIDIRNRDYIEGRVRAGVLEPGTVRTLVEAGVGNRLLQVGLQHTGFELRFQRERHRVDLLRLTGEAVTIYGQTEITKDLFKHRIEEGAKFFFDVTDVTLNDLKTGRPTVAFNRDNKAFEIQCDFVAGCDGFHGVSRRSIPPTALRTAGRDYPFAWLGVLVDKPPVNEELAYINHENGFALCSMRSKDRSRYYLQCGTNEIAGNWSDTAFWDELSVRVGPDMAAKLQTGVSIEKSITRLRSLIVEPMTYGALFLAGDAAHIVPPTGAKGLNLAVADIKLLARGFSKFYKSSDTQLLVDYSQTALAKVRQAEQFSWQMSRLLHKFPAGADVQFHDQYEAFQQIANSGTMERTIARNYVGLPI